MTDPHDGSNPLPFLEREPSAATPHESFSRILRTLELWVEYMDMEQRGNCASINHPVEEFQQVLFVRLELEGQPPRSCGFTRDDLKAARELLGQPRRANG